MGIYYKPKEIDYEKTLGELQQGQSVEIPTKDRDITNIRNQVSKVSKRLPESMTFKVSKVAGGALVLRTA